MNKNAKLYVIFIMTISLILITINFTDIIENIKFGEFIFFVMFLMISELLSLQVDINSNISFGFAIAYTSAIVLIPELAATYVFFGMLFAFFDKEGKIMHIFNSSFLKRIFNASSYFVTVYVSSLFYHSFYQKDLIVISDFGILTLIGTVLVYLGINNLIFMTLFALINKTRVITMISKNFWAFKNFLFIAPLGIMMTLFYKNFGMFGLLLFFGPLFLARYSFKLYLNMKTIYIETIKALTKAIDAKDEYTKGHSFRVAEYAVMIGKELKMSEPSLEILKTAGLLHDVGKIGISDNILLKPGKLSPEEMEEIRNHPNIGAEIIEDIEFLDKARICICQHHERYDGKGYPNNIKGEDMPLESRILSVADAFDAMTTDRAYRKAFSEDKAIQLLIEEREKQFSPEVVDAILSLKKNRGSVIIYAD